MCYARIAKCGRSAVASVERDSSNGVIHGGLLESRGLRWKPPCFINVSAGELRTSGPRL